MADARAAASASASGAGAVAVMFNSGVIATGDHAAITVHLPAQIPSALSGLRRVSPSFTGREREVRALLDLLDPAGRTAVVLAGLGGVGKTELAVRTAHAALAEGWFPGGVLFEDLHGYDPGLRRSPESVLESFLRRLGVAAEHIPGDLSARQSLYRTVLAAFADERRPILVVLDNAAVGTDISALLPGEDATGVLVTSRHTLTSPGARVLNLDVLDGDTAVALLEGGIRVVCCDTDARVRTQPAEAQRLARQCGFLPLALAIVASLLARVPGKPLAAMAAELADERRRLDELVHEDGADGSAIAVRAAFELSYRQLSEDQMRVFRLLPLAPGPDAGTESLARLADVDVRTVRRFLESLAAAHLIMPGAVYDRWTLHDLVRLYADELGRAHAEPDGREDALDRLLDYFFEATDAASSWIQSSAPKPGPVGFGSRVDALGWMDHEISSLLPAAEAAVRGQRKVAAGLGLNLGSYLMERRRFADAYDAGGMAMVAAEQGGDQQAAAGAWSNIGSALSALGRFSEAAAAHKHALAIFRAAGNLSQEAHMYTNLGNDFLDAKDFDLALAAFERSAKMNGESGDRQAEGDAYVNLAAALFELGRLEDSLETYRRAVDLYDAVGDRHRAATAGGNLGVVQHKLGHVEDALATSRRAAGVHRELGDHHGEAVALANLGEVFESLGRGDEAVEAYRSAAQLAYQANDPSRAAEYANALGNALRSGSRYDEAIAAYREAIGRHREVGLPVAEGETWVRLGLVQESAGQAAQSGESWAKAAQLFEAASATDQASRLQELLESRAAESKTKSRRLWRRG